MATTDITPSLNHWYITSPQSEIRWNAFCHVALKTAAVVACVAAVALAASVLIFAFLAASGTSMPIGLAVASFASFPLTHFASVLWNKSKKYLAVEQQERRVHAWQTFLSKDFLLADGTLHFEKIHRDPLFSSCGIYIEEKTLTEIQRHLPIQGATLQKASEAWLSVAARFMHELEITRKPIPEIAVLDKNSPIERERALLRKHNYKEMHIFQHTLTTAILSAIARSPFIQAVHFNDLGSLNIKSKMIRREDRKHFGQDDYFIPKDKQAPSIPVRGCLKQIALELTTTGLLSQNSAPQIYRAQEGENHFLNPDHQEFKVMERKEKFSENFAEEFQKLQTMLFQEYVLVEDN